MIKYLVITTCGFTVGEPAYVMNILDIEQSLTLLLGHKNLIKKESKEHKRKMRDIML